MVITGSIDVRNVTSCSLVDDCQRFVGASCLHLEGSIDLTATIEETEGPSEIAVTIYLASHLKGTTLKANIYLIVSSVLETSTI